MKLTRMECLRTVKALRPGAQLIRVVQSWVDVRLDVLPEQLEVHSWEDLP